MVDRGCLWWTIMVDGWLYGMTPAQVDFPAEVVQVVLRWLRITSTPEAGLFPTLPLVTRWRVPWIVCFHKVWKFWDLACEVLLWHGQSLLAHEVVPLFNIQWLSDFLFSSWMVVWLIPLIAQAVGQFPPFSPPTELWDVHFHPFFRMVGINTSPYI